MTAWVLVHSPATGPLLWRAVAELLRAGGDAVVVPALTGTLTAEPGWATRQVETAAVQVRQSAVEGPYLLAGHSWAGTLLPSIGHRLGGIAGYAFVDAALPRPGLSFADTAPAELLDLVLSMADGGWLRPWPQWWGGQEMAAALPEPAVRAEFEAQCRPLPLGMFYEPALWVPGWPDAPCGYLRLSPAYRLDDARALGWRVADLDGDHLSPLTEPHRVLAALHELTAGW